MMKLSILFLCFYMTACVGDDKSNLPGFSRKFNPDASTSKDTQDEAPTPSKDKTKSAENTPDAGSETINGKEQNPDVAQGCCELSFDKLEMEIQIEDFDRTFTTGSLDQATIPLSLAALDAIEGLSVRVYASMKMNPEHKLLFTTHRKNEKTIEVEDISFEMPGNWIIHVEFLDGDKVVDESSLEIEVVEEAA